MAQWTQLKKLQPIILLALVGCMRPYWSESIEGGVVDADTKAPLSGVNVVVYWDIYGGLEGGNYEGNLNVMETETDKAGRYSFPSWGPKWSSGIVRTWNPSLAFFRSGYKIEIRSNNDPRMGQWGGPMRSDWSGKTVTLAPMAPSSAEYLMQLEGLSHRLQTIGSDHGGRCDWERFARAIVALEREYQTLERSGVIAANKDNVYRHLIRNNSAVAGICSVAPSTILRGVQ